MEKHRTSAILDQILQNLDGSNTNEENAANSGRDDLTATPDEAADTIFRPAGMMKDTLNADSTFYPETLLVGEVMMIAIIVAAIQSSLIPTFHVDLTSIKHKDSTAAATCTSFTPSSAPKITYPSLTFIDKRRNFHITFSMVPIFGEMVIYAMKKNLLDDNIIQLKSDAQLSTTTAVADSESQEARRNGNGKKKMIQTLYMNPNDFISEYSSSMNEKNKNKNNKEEEEEEEEGPDKNSNQLINHDFNLESLTGDGIDNKNNKVNKNRVLCGSSKIQIGKYVTKFHDLTSRIEKTLLDPLLFEK